MSVLAYNDFFKLATKADKGISRKEKFCAKIRNSNIGSTKFEPTFTMKDNTTVIFPIAGKDPISISNKTSLSSLYAIKPTGEAAERQKYNTIKFKTSDGKVYGMSSFVKTKEFGGGGGSGGGADVTKYTESGQCYVCSLVFNVLDHEIKTAEDFSYDNLVKSVAYCDTGLVTLDNIIEKVGGDYDWTCSMIKTANFLYSKYRSKFMGKIYFHRDSVFMNKVYSYHKECLKINPVLGSFDKNKWNPGDIWMTTFVGPQFLPELPTATWPDLNGTIYELACKNKLLGVSLKKVTGASVTLEEYNKPKVKKHQYTYGSYRLSASSNDFFNSIDMYMNISGIEIQFRATATIKSWQGEVKGGSAAGGKIGGGNVNAYLKKYTGKNLFESSESEVFSFTKTTGFMKEFFRLYTLYYNGVNKLLDFTAFQADAEAKDADSPGSFYFSKYMNLKFLDIFLDSGCQNKLASDFMYYAKSNLEESSYFIKVS